MPGVREFFQTPKGQAVAGVFLLAGIAAAAYSILNNPEAAAVRAMNTRWFVDADNDKAFEVDLAKSTVPAVSPFSGKKTGFPAELCFWTKDGKAKATPTPVLLAELKNQSGPTFCPDCDRLVVGHNPAPNAETKAPPTRAEYGARR